jgi:hypothetical protein
MLATSKVVSVCAASAAGEPYTAQILKSRDVAQRPWSESSNVISYLVRRITPNRNKNHLCGERNM